LNDLTRNTTDATIRAANTTTEVRFNIQFEIPYPHIASRIRHVSCHPTKQLY